MFPFSFPPLISKFKLLKLLWFVSGCLFQCTQFRILVHHTPSEILFHFVFEFLHWDNIIQVHVLAKSENYANSLHVVHQSPEVWIF